MSSIDFLVWFFLSVLPLQAFTVFVAGMVGMGVTLGWLHRRRL